MLFTLVVGFSWYSNLIEYKTDWTPRELSAGGWCQVAGKNITVTGTLEEVNDWCCTVNGNEMTFYNFIPFKYGQRESYTHFQAISFVPNIWKEHINYAGQQVTLTGQLDAFSGVPQIIINEPTQLCAETVWEEYRSNALTKQSCNPYKRETIPYDRTEGRLDR